MGLEVEQGQASQVLRQLARCVGWAVTNVCVLWGATWCGDPRIHTEWASANPPPSFRVAAESAVRRDASRGILAIEDYLASVPSASAHPSSADRTFESGCALAEQKTLDASKGFDHRTWTTRRFLLFARPYRDR